MCISVAGQPALKCAHSAQPAPVLHVAEYHSSRGYLSPSWAAVGSHTNGAKRPQTFKKLLVLPALE